MNLRPRLRRLAGLLCALALLLGAVPAASAVGTAGLPSNWWSVWGPYSSAVESGDMEQIYKAGLAVEKLYTKQKRTVDIANQLAVVYDRLLSARYFENKGDYAGAADNTRKLIDVAQYLANNGVADYRDSVIEGRAHLEVLGPFTGVYAASYTAKSDYASAIAPVSGSYYGSVFQGYFADSGRGSVASVYVNIENETAQKYDYILQRFSSGGRVIEVNLNYAKEGATARAIPSDTYDANLNATLRCLAKYSCPILLRIGGEMNIWSDAANPTADYVSPADFIASYRYIAAKARSLCPKVELVWSPMYATRWGESFGDFWPGDAYVDWVGVSFYYNYADKGYTAPAWLEHNRLHQFADPLLCMKNIAAFADEHGKPVIATEGGAYKNGPKGEAYAAAQNAKAFAVVTMVYPQVKALVYFDMNIAETDGDHDYRMTGAFRTAAVDAIDANPTLIGAGSASAATYVPLGSFSEKADSLILGATGYTYNDTDMKVTYALDGAAPAAGTGPANRYVIGASALAGGAHTLKVTFTDKVGYSETKTYTIVRSAAGTIRCAEGTAIPAETIAGFSDVYESDYYADAVAWALAQDITNGIGGGRFGPAQTLSRCQAVTFLWRAKGRPAPKSRENPFSDVKSGEYYYDAVLWAVENGITNGIEGGKFGVDDDVTRGQMITFLWRTEGRPDDTGGAWYEAAENWANANGLLDGTAVRYSTDGLCPRSDVVYYLWRDLA